MTNDNPATVPTPSAASSAQLTALEKFGKSGGSLHGELLKFSGKTGVWTAGSQSVEVPIGTQLVAVVPELEAGFIKWVGGTLAGEVLRPVAEDYDPKALRASLGDTDPTEWPKGDDGRPADPWKECAYLPMADPKSGARYVYSTSSIGGTRIIKQLCHQYAWQVKAAPETTADHLPVVELGASSYKHADRRRGKIFNPVLEGVDWVPASTVLDKDGDASAASSSFEDHRPGKQKKRRKAAI